MLYFFIEVNMENQINVGDQNTQQVGQNSDNQSVMSTEKPRANYLLIVGIVLACFVLFGFGGYYLGKKSLKTSDEPKQTQPIPSPNITGGNEAPNLKTYKNSQNGIEFDYPQNYAISANPTNSTNPNYANCMGLTNNQAGCLLSLALNPTNSEYTPKANFWLLKGINSVNIPGQVSSINFDSQKRAWIVNNSVPKPEVLLVWNHTKTGQEIIKSSNGGSHGSSHYYIIPKNESDEVAIFSIPESYRLRCDNFVNDKPKEIDCNNFYKSVIDQYNNGEVTDDTWLPENYLKSIYAEAENIVKSYREVAK